VLPIKNSVTFDLKFVKIRKFYDFSKIRNNSNFYYMGSRLGKCLARAKNNYFYSNVTVQVMSSQCCSTYSDYQIPVVITVFKYKFKYFFTALSDILNTNTLSVTHQCKISFFTF